MIQNPSVSLSYRRFIINRYNVKFFIRILVGLTLAHIIGHQFQLSNASPNRKANLKYRLQKTTTTNG
jgi:hypothetical protein